MSRSKRRRIGTAQSGHVIRTPELVAEKRVSSPPEIRTDMCPNYGGAGFFSVKSTTAVNVKLWESPRQSRGFTYSNYRDTKVRESVVF